MLSLETKLLIARNTSLRVPLFRQFQICLVTAQDFRRRGICGFTKNFGLLRLA